MLSESLTKRERLVLEALVRAYVDLRTPVGSRTILVRESFEFSPATMRKTLSSLERKGSFSSPIPPLEGCLRTRATVSSSTRGNADTGTDR